MLRSVLRPEITRRITSDSFESDSLETAFQQYALLDEKKKRVVGICEGFEGNLKMPEGIEAIEKNVFLNSNAINVGFPNSIRFIAESAFANCQKLKSVRNFRVGDKRAKAFLVAKA